MAEIKHYGSVDDMLDDLHAVEKNKYFLCDCPSCGQHEAFMYKKNVNLIYCNRQSECGEMTRVAFDNGINRSEKYVGLEKETSAKASLSPVQKKELASLSQQISYVTDVLGGFQGEKFSSYRGLSQDVYSPHVLIAPNQDFGIRLVESYPHLLEQYNTKTMKFVLQNRDIALPYFNEKGELERILLRSSTPEKDNPKYIKEVNLIVKPNQDMNRDYHTTIDFTSDAIIVLGETTLDAKSLVQVDRDIEFIAASGCNHVAQTKEFLIKHQQELKNRKFIIAFDDDKAGRKRAVEFEALLNKLEIKHTTFLYPEAGDVSQDLNGLLQQDPSLLKAQLEASISTLQGDKPIALETEKEADQQHVLHEKDILESQATPAKKLTKKEQVTELLQRAEDGIKEYLASEKYQSYLRTMSKFHTYSYRNVMLILSQNPDATRVAGYKSWKNNFNRQVQSGEKGIKIIGYVPRKVEQEVTKMVNGKERKVKETVTIPGFSPMTVFDISQTKGDPLPTLTTELKGDIKDFDKLFQAIEKSTTFSVEFEEMEPAQKGYCSFWDDRIAIKKGMSPVHTIKTLIHEVAHSILHDPKNVIENTDRRRKEIEAESVAFVICSKYGIDTSDYSFPYLASYSSSHELEELKQSFDKIQKQSSALIEKIESNLEGMSIEKSKTTLADRLRNAAQEAEQANRKKQQEKNKLGLEMGL
ncbi:toprim domain-containing protein [Listeria booriae]|uniref:ArdC-like ssDNA-binding domain-containing protein n=1 Tax=Listeria booriae TaxID=1552123 RepID=UPI001627EDE9|nr:ArdC-like ssDNA-binding domain-containing protein [Listeria booriae]MBC1890074.1 toprim domain-containing protein [Listeria booriae]